MIVDAQTGGINNSIFETEQNIGKAVLDKIINYNKKYAYKTSIINTGKKHVYVYITVKISKEE